jgi:hypothetical protein
MDFNPLSPKKQKRLLYGFKAAPVKLMEDETDVCPIFVATPVVGSMVAMYTAAGFEVRASPYIVFPNWEKVMVQLSVNKVNMIDFM